MLRFAAVLPPAKKDANRRFGVVSGLPFRRAALPERADCVDLVGNMQRQRKNRIQAPHFLNQCCAPDSRLESILLNSPRQNVYQHNLPQADTLNRSS
jgi:hypothetical protein